jgi:hypothetical protein
MPNSLHEVPPILGCPRLIIGEIWLDGMDWHHLAPDADMGRVLVNTVMNFPVP